MLIIGGLPNLELLEYKSKDILKKINNEKYKNVNLRADVFLQTWSSTALGFNGIGGQAISEAYTTVFGDILENVYVIFFGNELAYIVENPTEKFFTDLKLRDMASVSKSKSIY